MIIRLNRKFYSETAVREALNDFKHVCKGRIVSEAMAIEILPKDNVPFLKEEFYNYVLALMKNKALV
jgi:hypothetical protein